MTESEKLGQKDGLPESAPDTARTVPLASAIGDARFATATAASESSLLSPERSRAEEVVNRLRALGAAAKGKGVLASLALEPMTGSQTGLGICAGDGTLCELLYLREHSDSEQPPLLYLRRRQKVEGPYLMGAIEETKIFSISATDSNPSASIDQHVERDITLKCQRALANNHALKGRLSVRGRQFSGIQIVYTGVNGDRFLFRTASGDSGDISIGVGLSTPDYRDQPGEWIPGSFDPATVTPQDLDGAIEAFEKSRAP